MAITDLLPPVRALMDTTIAVGQYFGLTPTVTSTFRSISKQAQLRAAYESCLARGATIGPSNADPNCRYPANAPGDSAHNFGLAWDSSVPDDQYPDWNAVRAALGWTLDPNDRVHAEVPGWRAIAQLMISLGWVDMPASLNVALSAPNSPTVPRSPPPSVSTLPAQLPAFYVSGWAGACQQAKRSHPGYRVFCNGVLMG